MVSIALFSSKRKINFVDVILSDCQLSAWIYFQDLDKDQFISTIVWSLFAKLF
jgi:hypothetical protein